MNQTDIIEEIKSGDQLVFSKLVTDLQDRVYNTAISIVQNAEDAEDITQEVFIKLHESLHSFRGDSLISTWIYRVTINKALDHEKKKKRQKRGGLQRIFSLGQTDEPAHFNHPGVIAENKEKAAMLFKAIKQLPENQRITFILHKIEGQSLEEISQILNRTVVSVESLVARAKVNLRKILSNWYQSLK